MHNSSLSMYDVNTKTSPNFWYKYFTKRFNILNVSSCFSRWVLAKYSKCLKSKIVWISDTQNLLSFQTVKFSNTFFKPCLIFKLLVCISDNFLKHCHPSVMVLKCIVSVSYIHSMTIRVHRHYNILTAEL